MTDNERGGWEPAVDLEQVPGVALQAEVQVVWLVLEGRREGLHLALLVVGNNPPGEVDRVPVLVGDALDAPPELNLLVLERGARGAVSRER